MTKHCVVVSCMFLVCVCLPRFVCLFGIGNLAPLRVVICAVAVSFIATCVLLASRVYVCMCVWVCTQVGCSVVRNWSLCDLSVDVCGFICSDLIFCL
jgi:hypothetical protein